MQDASEPCMSDMSEHMQQHLDGVELKLGLGSQVSVGGDAHCNHNMVHSQLLHPSPSTHTKHNLAVCYTRVSAHSTAHHSTAHHSTAQHSTAQHSTAQHSTAQHSTVQHNTVL